MLRLIAGSMLLLCLAAPAFAGPDAAAVNNAEFKGKPPADDRIEAVVVKAQVLLDRASISPGEIDGKPSARLPMKAIDGLSRIAAGLPAGHSRCEPRDLGRADRGGHRSTPHRRPTRSPATDAEGPVPRETAADAWKTRTYFQDARLRQRRARRSRRNST